MKQKKYVIINTIAIMILTSTSAYGDSTSDPQPETDRQPITGELIQVECGTFIMGSTNDSDKAKPVHQVTVQPFYIGKYEVTQKEWKDVMGTNASHYNGDNLPVEMITWHDAIEYCNKRSVKEGLTPAYTVNGQNVTWNKKADGYRLPTEAEWEYAARGGNNGSAEFIYSGSNTVDDVAWYSENSGNKTHEVGQKKPNDLGLYDMSGNVWEWCWDWYEGYPNEPQTDPSGALTGSTRIPRGGPYYDGASQQRVAYRGAREPSYLYNSIGLRVVRSLISH